MGRHEAGDDAPVHPLVAEALARRPAEVPAAHRPARASEQADDLPGERGPIGWPGPDPETEPAGAPIGWPGSTSDEADRPPVRRGADAEEAAAPDGAGVLTVPAPPRRRGRRRFSGGDRAA